MKKYTLFLVFAVLFAACQSDQPSTNASTSLHGLRLNSTAEAVWQYENLRVYPILADDATLQGQVAVQELKTLAEGMKIPGFRITELKQFGRSREPQVNSLTVQNKSQETILLLSGDIVTGGNQDRVIAHDEVVLPGTVKNLEVFCVEKGRWHFSDSTATANEKAIYAFNGYYNVASPQVRQAVQRTGSQQEVWAAVAKITTANRAESATHTYTALEAENAEKTKRSAYLHFFENKLTDRSNVVGMVVVCGDQLLGVDIFGHPDLFKRQYNSLLHGYIAEAVGKQSLAFVSEAAVRAQFSKVAELASSTATPTEETGKFSVDKCWVHLYSK